MRVLIAALLFASTAVAAPLPLKVDGGLQMKPQATTTISSRWWGLWNKYGAPFWFGAGVQSQLLAPYPGKFSVSQTATATSTSIHFAVSSDFNNDGKADVAVTNNTADNVSILIGNGDGTFVTPSNTSTGAGTGPIEVVAVDLNNDNNQDVVTVNRTTNNISVLMGNGGGGLAAAVQYATGATLVEGLASGDFDGDGDKDVVVIDLVGNNALVLLNNGSGVFGAAVAYNSGAGTFPYEVTVGDFNNDGKLDLAVGCTIATKQVAIFRGNGNGTFVTPPSYFAVADNAGLLAAADLNGDGNLDLVVPNAGGSSSVSVLIGNGAGSFAAAVNYATGATQPYGLVLADINHDGVIDIVTDSLNSAKLSTLLGVGNGTFSTASVYTIALQSNSLAAGDFNGDGRTDLVAAPSASSSAVSILLNSPTQYPAFTSTPAFNCSQGGSISMTLTANLGSWTIAQGLPGDLCTLTFIQGDASTRTIGTPPANIAWLGTTYNGTVHSAPVLTTATANAVDSFNLIAVPTYTGSVTNGQATMWVEMNRCMKCTHP